MSKPRQHYFYNITRKVIINFLDIFNNITIARYNELGKIHKFIKIPVKFAPKTKQWYWTELKNNQDRRDSIFPMIGINLESMEYSSDRQVNRNAKIVAMADRSSSKRYLNPVPYDYTFKVLIVSQYLVDITQIIEQVLVNFAPEAYIRITIPELNITGLNPNESGADKLELRVTCEGSQKDTPVELDEEAYRLITWELTFKVQGYLFTPYYESKPIHKVVQNYYLSDEAWAKRGQDIGDLTVTNIRMYTVPISGIYTYPLSVQIRSFDPVDEIYYSFDGSNYTLYEGAIILDSPSDIYYYGVKTGVSTSPVYHTTFIEDDGTSHWNSIDEFWDSLNIDWDQIINI